MDQHSEFIYRAGSTKINHYFQSSVEYGNTIVRSLKKFKDLREKDAITFFVLNDIHENVNLFKKLLSNAEYDFIVLNGDIINSADNRKVVTEVGFTPHPNIGSHRCKT